MIKIILALLISNLIFASGEISLNACDDEKLQVKYTIQIASSKSKKNAQKATQKVPLNLKKDLHLYKIGKYIALRYSSADKSKDLKKALHKFIDIGFKDAYIVKSTKWHMRNSILDKSMSKKAKKEEKKVVKLQHSITKYRRTNILQKADKAYKNSDESTAMLYYEMLLNSNSATQKVKNNLCYLYGKRGAWFEAKKIIEKERYASKLIYAYAYGAMQTNQDNFMLNLSQYIMMDKSGRLALLAGYYYEQKEDINRALGYYKISYNKNPSDIYNMFAYARSLDIKKDYVDALKFYKKLLFKIDKSNKNYDVVRKRVYQLQEERL